MSNFIEQAMRTNAPVWYGENVDYENFLSKLRECILVANELDQMKKTLFYNRNPSFNEKNVQELKEYVNIDVLHGILGVITEAGELAEFLLKGIETKDFDFHNLAEETGDVKWYLALITQAIGNEWDTDEKLVIEKLKKRFPDKFTEKNANNRDLETERQVIETLSKQ